MSDTPYFDWFDANFKAVLIMVDVIILLRLQSVGVLIGDIHSNGLSNKVPIKTTI